MNQKIHMDTLLKLYLEKKRSGVLEVRGKRLTRLSEVRTAPEKGVIDR